jgi:peptide/nickel transport system substrate-binding protein
MSASRREFLIQSGLAVTTAAVASAIGLNLAEAGDGDTISIALASRAPVGLNPQQTGLNGGDNWAINQLFDTLVKPPEGRWAVKPDEFLPSIAESWESSADAKTWTYKIRKGVKFHKNYGEVTADDVVFTFQRQLDPKQVTANKVIYANIASCEAVDPMTVRFTL